MLNIIGNRKIWFSISGILVIVSVFAIVYFGFKPGIDFTGGTLWQIKMEERQDVNEGQLSDFFNSKLGVKDAQVYKETSTQSFILRLQGVTEDQHQFYLASTTENFGSLKELRFETIGPAISSQLKSKAIWATIFVLFAISIYVAISFRKVSFPVKSWKYGVTTLISLFHDVIIPAGLLAFLGYFKGVEVDTNFVVALLVVVGFSVHDTIVVFDRIRENLLIRRGNVSFDTIVNESVNQTLARSINTSLTLVLILLAMFFFGTASLKLFVLIMLVGTIAGTYSSIFIASPLLTLWHRFGKNR